MSAAHRVGRRVRLRLLQDSRKGRLPLLPLSGTRSAHIALKQGLSPKLYANYTETSLLGFAPPVLCRPWPESSSKSEPALKREIHMKKMLALLAVLCSTTAAFAQSDAVVRWKTIVGNITVSNNDAVGGINPGTTPWSTVGGRARVNLATGHVSFDVDGLVLNGGNATGTPGGVDQVEGSLICDAGQKDQTIFTTTPVPLSAQGNADFSGTFNTIPGNCTNPLFLIRIGPDLPGANQRWIATGAVRSFGDSNGHN